MDYLHDRTVGKAFQQLCWRIGTPFAYKAILMQKRQDWVGLTNLKVAVGLYTCAKTLSGDLQVAAFFKKYPDFDLGRDLKAEAIASFWATEHQCYQSNERLSPLLFDSNHYGERLGRLLRAWRKEIKLCLGRAPLLSQLKCKFGPGSTFLNVGDEITIAHKLSENYSHTRQATFVLSDWDLTAWSRYAASGLSEATLPTNVDCVEHQNRLFSTAPDEQAFAIRDSVLVRGNRFTTVRKDANKHRGICIEPSINLFYQLGMGDAIASRLGKWGWDKRSAQSYHKQLAQIGSLTGAISTIDLSNASDTICSNLVKLLLPPSWFRLLDDLRSHHTLIGDRWAKLEKFSSMGNGFTFELETLVFWGLARALGKCEQQTEDPYTPGVTTSVFGDDIIIPTSLAQSYLAAIKFFGFTANTSKTFVKGSFRESCGGDFFRGLDVRPYYLKETPDEPHKLIAFANGLRRFNIRHNLCGGDDVCHRAWLSVYDAIPRPIRQCVGPETLGDLVLHVDESVWTSNTRTKHSIRYLRVWRPIANRLSDWSDFRPGVIHAVALYGASSGSPSSLLDHASDIERFRRSGYVPRVNGAYVSGYKFGRVPYS